MSPLALRRRITWPAIVIIVLAAAAVLLFVLERRTAAQAADYRSARVGAVTRDGRIADSAARAAAQQAAVTDIKTLLSYDATTLDRDFAKARGYLTGAFRDEYKKTTTTVVAPTAEKYHGVVQATVVEPSGGGAPTASVVSASPDKVVVLLFVNQVTKSTQVTGSRLDLNRVRMTLTRTSGGWKVSAVDAL